MAKKTMTKKATVKKPTAKKVTKKTMVKKPTAKKPSAAKPKKTRAVDKQREGAAHAALAKELKTLIPKLDAQGLAFLIEQSRIHIYNMQVDELNKATLAARTAKIAKAAKAAKQAGSGKKSNTKKTSTEEPVIVGTEGGNSYFLYYRNSNISFSREEMIHMVKMVNAGGSPIEISERLFNWFERERSDVFHLIRMTDKFDSRLKSLAVFIKKNFKLRG